MAVALGVDVGLGAGGAMGFSARLATLDLAELDEAELVREIELEARRLLELDATSLRFEDGATPNLAEPLRTPGGVVVPIVHGSARSLLVGEGVPPEGWQEAADTFARQAGALLRAHQAVVAGRRREAELWALAETAEQVAGRADVDRVLAAIVRRARDLLETDGSSLALANAADDGVSRRVIATGEAAYSADYLADDGFDHDPASDEEVRRKGVRSILGVPLRGREGVIGALCVASRDVRAFDAREVGLLRSLGDHAALALESARLAAAADELGRVEEVHRSLTRVVLAGEGVEGVTGCLARALDVGVMVTDWRQTVLAHVGCGEHLDGHGAVSPALLRRQEVRQALLECAGAYSAVAAGEGWLVAPIVARQEILGYVWALVERATAASGFVRTSLEQAAQVVALEVLRARAASETERRLRRDFSQALLGDPPAGAAALERMARQVWPRFGLAHRPVAIWIAEDGPASSQSLEQAREVAAETRPGDFTSFHGGHVLLMLEEADRTRSADEVTRLRTALGRRGLAASVVVGGVCRDLAADRESLRNALRLHDLLGPRPVLWLEELEVLTVLFDPDRRDRLRQFLDKALAPLAGHPLLIATLDAYYGAACNRALAARQLNVHVNTLRYRLERIESLIGGPVDDPCRAVPLRVALLARETI